VKKLLSVLGLVFLLASQNATAWISFLDGGSLPQSAGWTLDGSDTGTIVDLGAGNQGIQQTDDSANAYVEWYLVNTNQASTLAARFRVDAFGGGPVNLLQLTPANSGANPAPGLAVAIRDNRLFLIRYLADSAGAPVEDARLADLGPLQIGVFYEAYLYIDNGTDRVRLFWNGGLRYSAVDTNLTYQFSGGGYAEFGASNYWPEGDRSGTSTVTFDWVGLGRASDLPLNLPFIPWALFLDGSGLPQPPWQPFTAPDAGDNAVIDFLDPFNQATNQAVRLNSGNGANEWFVGPFLQDEVFGGARLRVASFSETGKENLLSIVTRSQPLSPAPAITLVDGRYKLWSYVDPDTAGNPGSEIADIGPVNTNDWHTAYLYARKDGRVRLWWDGQLLFDGSAPLVNPYDGYFEWGSGSWQYDASDTVDFDWVAYASQSLLPTVTSFPTNGAIFQEVGAGFSFTNASVDGVDSSGVAFSVNGVDRTSELIISGDNNNRQGFWGGLGADQLYQIVLIFTEQDGDASTNTIVFDTFSPANFMFEAEDWNIDDGNFIDNPPPSAYFDATASEGIDHHELSTEFAASQHEYRAFVLVGTEKTGDILRQKYLDAQATDPNVTDYNVGWVEIGEWLNYTRTYPAGDYYLYGRFADGNIGEFFEATLDKVANATSESQTVTPVGVFHGGPGRGWQSYDFVPLTDAQGNHQVVALNGIETLRVTATQGGYNANFYMLVPAPPRLNITRSGGSVVISWFVSGWTLQSAPSLDGPWDPVQNQSNPYMVTPSPAAQYYRLVQ